MNGSGLVRAEMVPLAIPEGVCMYVPEEVNSARLPPQPAKSSQIYIVEIIYEWVNDVPDPQAYSSYTSRSDILTMHCQVVAGSPTEGLMSSKSGAVDDKQDAIRHVELFARSNINLLPVELTESR